MSGVIRSPAGYMAEYVPLDPRTKKKKKKQRVNLEPPRPMAARLKKTQRVNLEPPRPMARLKKKKTAGKPRTASAYGRAVTALFNNMRILKFKSQRTNAFFATVNQIFGGSFQLPTIAERAVIKSNR